MLKLIALLSVLALSTSCLKTADQVQREKKFDTISEQMSDSQGLISDLSEQVKDQQNQINKLNGKIEELEYKLKQSNQEGLKSLTENLNLLKEEHANDKAQLEAIQNELKEQRAFIEKVTESLKASHSRPDKTTHNKEKRPGKGGGPKADLQDALDLVASNQYEEARNSLLGLLDNPELTPGDQNKTLHGLGRVEYFSKNYDKALTYFSKVYSKYPKASLAPSSLLFIGRSLKKMGKTEEAKEAFAKLKEDYPGSKEVIQAKKEL